MMLAGWLLTREKNPHLMSGLFRPKMTTPLQLGNAVGLSRDKILNPPSLSLYGGISAESPILVVLAAGRGTRFGQDPKCIQPVHGTPLVRHTIAAYRRFQPSPVICLVGHRANDVMTALGADNIYVQSGNPTGGTAFAAFEAFSVPDLMERNPVLIITYGDRIIPSSAFRHLHQTHMSGEREADLTFLTAQYEPPKNRGKGRVLRGPDGHVLRIIEEGDIAREADGPARQALMELTEGNCPLYALRAATLYRHAQGLTNDNAQGQYYLTDLIEIISRERGDVRTVTTTVTDPEYDLLCSDVTRPMDLALLEGLLASVRGLLFPEDLEAEEAAQAMIADRPAGQVASIARQLGELMSAAAKEKLGFLPDRPIGIGISGGRLRIAFMHPDMFRFFGPAWQMSIGAADEQGEEQIVVLLQSADDGRIHLFPINPKYRESINFVPSDNEVMYPGESVSDLHTYEVFGTRMSESLLLSLGYFNEDELEARRKKGQPLPPPSLWVGSNMRRPFALVGNAIASMRTLRSGNLGAKIREHLGRDNFRGLRLISTGNIAQGGFSSSSALTVATKNAINALWKMEIPPDVLVHLASQAEYGTGVRAGSLDQATEQKGRPGQGTLISSNPQNNYRIIGAYPVPADRFQIIFPYTAERDRSAWRWSWGAYGESSASGPLTTGEMRKLTGKAAEMAALLTRLPLDTDFFREIEDDLVSDGLLRPQSRAWICSVLRQLPLRATQEDLRRRLAANRDWHIAQMVEVNGLDPHSATQKTDDTIASVFAGWRDPILRHAAPAGSEMEECGAPLRAMVAYLFGEVAKNFYLIHHPEEWIECVTLSQRGDRSVEIDPDALPARPEMQGQLDWECGVTGPERLNLWLDRHCAKPFDFNQGLDDEALSLANPPEFHRLQGSNFFRGLALIDLAEAMLKRAFGGNAVAVRVNAAGQGDYFQVHVDTKQIAVSEVKQFIRTAFYRRFGLAPEPEFVEVYPGGGAVGIHLERYDSLPQLIQRLKAQLPQCK
jgi:hypothetical protein